MRKSIFEIASASVNMKNETHRIVQMALKENVLVVDSYHYKTLFSFVDDYCFECWEYRGHYVDVADFLTSIGFKGLRESAESNENDFLTLIELVYNFWFLSQRTIKKKGRKFALETCGPYYHLQTVMDDNLRQYNHVAYVDKAQKCVLVIEDKPEVTAAAEIVPSQLASGVIRYNHRSLQGDIETKKSILISLGAELEPKRKELQVLNGQLSDDIFFMLNNCNLRHNNCDESDSAKYRKYVAEMEPEQLEHWYDELYQMILLAFLLLDNKTRAVQVKELKANFTGGKTDGSHK